MKRPIFEEPPEDMGIHAGALLLNWNGNAGVVGAEVGVAFRVAAERLLDAALASNETWQATYPILFCYRHGLEVCLKSLLPDASHDHGLLRHWSVLRTRLAGHVPEDHLTWLGDRIGEFERMDPRSTAFRYADATPKDRPPELWVDFYHLRSSAEKLFGAIDHLRHLPALHGVGEVPRR